MIKTNIFTISLLLLITLLYSGCAKHVSKIQEFPKMYDQKPRSILILPPMNESTDAEAKDYYMTTVEMPFASMGYYTFPVEMVSDIMKQEGVYDTELLYELPLDKFDEYFGADAVLFTHIKKWDVSYIVISSSLTVSIDANIISTKTGEELWKYTGTVVVDLTASAKTGDALVDLVISAVATAINTATADYVKHAHTANVRLISSLPVGPYHQAYLKDQSVKIIDQTPVKSDKD
jgi:hypothetical protein